MNGAKDPGEVDNRLSLIPSAFPVIEDWEDGETYDLTDLPEGTKLRQISPGEFEVIPPVETAETEAEGEEEEAPKPRKYRNPAVDSMEV